MNLVPLSFTASASKVLALGNNKWGGKDIVARALFSWLGFYCALFCKFLIHTPDLLSTR